MELQLENLIKNVEIITNIHNQNKNPMQFKMPKDGNPMGLLFYCSYTVPRYVVLPENAIWFDYDPESPTYRHAFKRTRRDPVNPYKDEWKQLYFYEDSIADQFYNEDDLSIVNRELPPTATELTMGIGYLSYPQADSKVITDQDPSLTNARPPLPHEHPEKPATKLAINDTDAVPVQDQPVPQMNQVLVYKDNSVQWRKISEGELK